jgi:2-methylfumaryl-CoA isomerase
MSGPPDDVEAPPNDPEAPPNDPEAPPNDPEAPPNDPGAPPDDPGAPPDAGLLRGLRIIDISTYVAGPSSTMNLGQLGADVIRVDPVGGANDVRRLPLDPHGHSLYWAGLNKEKRSIQVDLRSEEGRDLVRALLASSGPGGGIVVTNAVGQDWLDYDRLAEVRPDVILVQIAGRADGGAAVDYTVNCEVGLPDLTGPVGWQGPVNHVLPAWDLLTGLYAGLAVLAAERERTRTGTGRHIRVALSDVAVATMANLGYVADVVVNGAARQREGNFLYGSFGCDFQTANGDHVMVVALTQRHWRQLVDLTGTAEAVAALERSLEVRFDDEESRYRYREVLASLFSGWFGRHGTEDVHAALAASQVLWGPYRTVEQMVTDPDGLLAGSDLFRDVDHPGIGPLPTPGTVLAGAGGEGPTRPASLPGADTDAVLADLLGLDGAALADLRRRGVTGPP